MIKEGIANKERTVGASRDEWDLSDDELARLLIARAKEACRHAAREGRGYAFHVPVAARKEAYATSHRPVALEGAGTDLRGSCGRWSPRETVHGIPLDSLPLSAARITRSDLTILCANRLFFETLQRSEADTIGYKLGEVLPAEALEERISQACAGPKPWHLELECRLQPDELRWFDLAWDEVPTEEGRKLILLLSDLTEHKRAIGPLARLAYHDALTDLPNRALFNDRMTMVLNRARRIQQPFAVMVLDLNRFKLVNDTLGHAAGDRLLQGVAGRLARCLRDSDTVARLGGDEFVVILPEVAKAEDASVVARKLLDTLAAPFLINGQELYASASIGISLYPHDGDNAETLLKNADLAMYRAKEQGAGYALYTAAMNELVAKRLALEQSLRWALERGEFVLYYQPQVSLKTGEVTGLETLIRWQHRDYGLIPPSEFIPVAEATGLIVPLGEWVLRTACGQARDWQARGLMPPRLAVNVSVRQFAEPGFIGVVQEVLDSAALSPGCLELELTEGLLHNEEATIEKLRILHEIGVQLSIDDFGTGYSPLSDLCRLPIQTLKIDKSFVSRLPMQDREAAVVAAIVSLGRCLNLNVVAEGVEAPAQLDHLRSIGCDEAQGFLISKPLPVEQIEAWLVGHRLPPTSST